MFRYVSALALLFVASPVLAQSGSCDAQERFGIVIHGGTSSGAERPDRVAFMETMLAERRAELASGASALDTVEAAIVAMEDSCLFNAGRAAITNSAGYVETDASIMDGRTLDAGAVASQLILRNPIRAARLVMEQTRHVMMVGDRGEAAVIALGAETVDPQEYYLLMRGMGNQSDEPKEHGTVGAAVLDRCGDLAAGTSTGGYGSKIPGRVGDSPIIGAGVYAENGVMAGSATGHGEYFIRHAALRTMAARMAFGGESLNEAARAVIQGMDRAGTGREGRDGRGGVVVIDAEGNVAMPHTTFGMFHGHASDTDAPTAGMIGEALR